MRMPVILLAGERPGGNPLAQKFGEPVGVLVEVAGKACITRTVEALLTSNSIRGGLICGPDPATRATSPVIRGILEATGMAWLPQADGPAESALASLAQVSARPVLLTAADHALLTPEIVDTFCQLALTREADFVVGFVPYDVVRTEYPESKRTVLKFADGSYCGSNLYLVRTAQGARVLELWREVQRYRKKPWRIATAIGLGTLLSYLTGRLTLSAALAAVGERAGCRIEHVEILNPRAAVDVDSVADHALAEQILG
jgi:GTP:adenosylcobinamide-phosphate guanylyltransferase